MLKFKKMNNKGVTLVELIVSFAIVSFAIIYFYQTLTTITKMYANARRDTTIAADVNYAFRLLDEAYMIDKSGVCNLVESALANQIDEYEDDSCDVSLADPDGTATSEFDKIEITIHDSVYTLYKNPSNTIPD